MRVISAYIVLDLYFVSPRCCTYVDFQFSLFTFYIAAESDPLSLQELCRGKIRHRLRQNIWQKYADLETKKFILPEDLRLRSHRALRRFVIPIFEESDEVLTDEEQDRFDSSVLAERQARFLLNVDNQPSEAISTTLQLVRAVIQPNQNDGWREVTRTNEENVRGETVENANVVECERRHQRLSSAERNATSSTSEDGTCHGPGALAEDNDDDDEEARSEEDTEKSSTAAPAYSNMSESESDAEQESPFMRCKKMAKREKTDSGIGGMEDINLSNEEGSFSSNTNHSDSEITDAADAMDIDLPSVPTNRLYKNVYSSRSSSKDDASRTENKIVGHYVDSNAFAAHMRDKIQQLPLPFSVKLYINYNRKF